MNRREFLASAAALKSISLQASAPGSISARPAVKHLNAAADTFACERQAEIVEGHLNKLLSSRSLPLAGGFTGVSPCAVMRRQISPDVTEAEFGLAPASEFDAELSRWIDGLGQVRSARFYLLAHGVVRFEITAENEHRVGHWKQAWRDSQLSEFRPLDETVVRAGKPLFEDITSQCLGAETSFRDQMLRGNSWWRARLDAATGIDVYANNGVAVADIDNDGQDEIYVCQQGGLPNRLYKNRGDGTFEDITEQSGLGILDDTTSALFVDFRNSGVQDVVLLRGSGPLYFRNDGRGRFTHQPDAFRFRNDPQGSFTGMAAADYDRDGKVDIYLCCYVYFQSEDQYRYPAPYHDARNGPPNFLFRNRLDETGGFFEDVTESVGLGQNNNRYSFAPAWCDYNDDGWPDLYVANDFGRNNLYRNSEGRFQDVAAEAGVEDIGPGMSAAWFDYDGDGRPDLYVSNMWTAPGQRIVHDPEFSPAAKHPQAYEGHTGGNSLFHNRGDGTFDKRDSHEHVSMSGWAWSSGAFDFDNDGSPEIFSTAGMLTNAGTSDLGSFFWRRVVAASPDSAAYAPEYEDGWNTLNELIREDYSWCGHERNVFYKRVGSRYYDFSGVSGLDFADDTRTFAATDIDRDGNLDLVLKSRLAPQIRVLRNNCGVGKPVAAFRLCGTRSNRDAIGAKVQAGRQIQYVTAGSGFLSQHSKTLYFALKDGDDTVRVTWPSGGTDTYSGVQPGFLYGITEGTREFTKSAFRSRVARPSAPVHPLNSPESADVWLLEPVPTPDRIDRSGLVVLFSGGRPALPDGVPVFAQDVSAAGPEAAARYAVLKRYLLEYRSDLRLPVALLIDDRSRIHKFYSSVPNTETAIRDWKRFHDPERLSLAVPFPGRYMAEPARNYFKLGAAFYRAGFPERALPYLNEEIRRSPRNWKALNAAGRIQLDAGRHREALASFEQVLAIRQDYPSAVLGAGEAAKELGDLQKAERMFSLALQQKPVAADASNQMGLLRVVQKRTSDAKQWFQRAIEIQKDHSGAINNLAVLYMQLGQVDDAVAAFEFGIEQAPDDEQLYMNLGRVYVTAGQMDRARDTIQRLLVRKPGNSAALRALAELASRQSR